MNTKQIAETILSQLGGRNFILMTGASNFTCATDANGNPFLAFRFKMFPKANYCQITLTPEDTYDMKFIKIHAGESSIFTKQEGLYCDMLTRIFRDVTGLETRMPTLSRVA